MPEYSNYVEGRPAAAALTGEELLAISQDGDAVKTTTQEIANLAGSGITREFNRAWSSELLFDKNEIDTAPNSPAGNITYTVAVTGHLVDEFSVIVQTVQVNGSQSISFTGFQFIYGIQSGEVPDAGTYQIFFMYRNGIASAQFTEPSLEVASGNILPAPSNFLAVANGENDIDLSWTDVANNDSYLIEYSEDGSTGWTTLSTPTANATTATQGSLDPGDTRYYRIKAVGNGTTYFDSPYASANATTEDGSDVTAPTFTYSPTNGSSNHSVNAPIVITANEPLQNDNGTALTDANIAAVLTVKQTNSGGADIPFTATIDATKTIITITPTTMWGNSQLVYLAIDNVEDTIGNEITLQSITFTTTDYTTFFNGSSNRMIMGDILDSVFAVNDTNFWLECTIKNQSLAAPAKRLISKGSGAMDTTFFFYYSGANVRFAYNMIGSPVVPLRFIEWAGVLDTGEHELVLKYDGSIDTNSGLDRCILEIDGVVQGSKSIISSNGTLNGTLRDSDVQLVAGIAVNAAGTPTETNWYLGEMKDLIIRSNNGATVELNIPILFTGEDISGNNRDGTWV